MKKHICTILCLLTVSLLVAIFVQGRWHPFPLTPLHGFTSVTVKPDFTVKSVASGDYQSQCEQYVRENFGFRELFIRTYNQAVYTCFGKINNDNIVKGLHQELFLKLYTNDVTGNTLRHYYPDVESAKTDAQKNVQETLRLIEALRRYGIKFLFVFAPSKTLVYPEYLPERYQDSISDFSLQEYYIELFKENNIPHIDFLNYFRAIKDTVAYPLYSRYGTHWAESTIPFVADSLYRKIEELTGFKLPSVKVVNINLTKQYSGPDSELEATMNLLFPLNKPAIPCPIFTLTDTMDADKPNLLVVSDSYFIQLRTSPFMKAFHHWDNWMYNREIYSSRERFNWMELQREFDAVTVLQEADIVVAVFTAPMFYKNYMYGFARSGQELLEKGYFNEEKALGIVKEMIVSDSLWYSNVVEKAKEWNISEEECLSRSARYWLDLLKYKIKQPQY